MKGSSMFVPGMCAGALLTLVMLAFVVGSVTSEPPRRAESQTFTVLLYAPVTATPAPTQTKTPTPTASTQATPASTSTPVPVRLRVLRVNAGEQFAFTSGQTSTASLEDYIPGRDICPIQPGTCPFGFLVGNLDPGISFPSENASLVSPNRLMHPAMVKPLASLRSAVTKTWPGRYALTVRNAFEATGVIAGVSDVDTRLSAQGQMAIIALEPQPEDAVVMARFCAMAFQAGFDWVRNIGNACVVAMRVMPLCRVCQQASTPTEVVLIPLITPTLTPTPEPTQTNASSHGTESGDGTLPAFSPSPIP